MTNEAFWEYQHQCYRQQPFPRSVRYEAWQPGRWAANRAAIRMLRPWLSHVHTVCEVGAGSAAFSLELGRQLGCELRAVDLCPSAAAYATEIAQDMGIPLRYQVGDLFSYSEKSDLVLSLGVIEHFSPKQQMEFVTQCKHLSNRYVLVAIPNQDSLIFRNYVAWSNRASKAYVEHHLPLTTDTLAELIGRAGMRVLRKDGFQVFLSERAFWNDTPTDTIPLYAQFRDTIAVLPGHWTDFPQMDFTYKDIPHIESLEMSLTPEQRLQYGFMSYVLAQV